LDSCTYASRRIIDKGLSKMQGPALLFQINKRISIDDIIRLQACGGNRKGIEVS
jgi:hypothetical protein